MEWTKGLTGLKLIADYRANRDAWLPLVDHASSVFRSRAKYGEVNIGWNAGEYEKGRPFFAECWAEDGLTMLTIFVSSLGMAETTAAQLDEHFQRIGFYKAVSEDRGMECLRFKDDAGNEFFSLNLLVGAEDDVFLEGAPILPYSELNAFNDEISEAQPENPDNGISYHEFLPWPCAPQCFARIQEILAGLREMDDEFLWVEFQNYPGKLVFAQACAYDNGNRFVVEAALGTDGKTEQIIRRDNLTRTGMIRAFKRICLKAEIPHTREWKDVTEEVFPDRKRVEGTDSSEEEAKATGRTAGEAASGSVDISWRKKDYTARLVFSRLPADSGQMEALLRLADDLQIRQDVALVIALPGRDDPQELLISSAEDGFYYMELSFPMGDFDWVHPLLLANDRLSSEQVHEILTAVLVDMLDTGDIDVIGEEFHEINSAVFGKL